MTKFQDMFSSQKQKKPQNGGKVPRGFLEMLKQSGEIQQPKPQPEKIAPQEKKDKKEEVYFQRVKKIEKEVYSRQKKETEKEIQLLRQALIKEIKLFKEKNQQLKKEVQAAIDQPIVNPGQSDITFFEKVITFIRKISQSVEESTLWMQAWNQKRAKKGVFWSNFTGKRGGAKYLLSSEHSVSRSAG